jgi:hypothetical protein
MGKKKEQAALCVAGCEVLRRAVKYGRPLRPARNARVKRTPSVVPQIRGQNGNQTALPAPPLAIEASNAVVPAVAESETIRLGG